jgi:4-amino-4-deoxy-L-arabinose transferase-like glycosyltransferase
VKEPPITEYISVLGYKIFGQEDLRIPRLLTSVFWIIGGFFLYSFVKNWGSQEGAVIALAYYLFIPLGVVLSVSFQPDNLMVMMFCISIYSILRFNKEPTWKKLLFSAAISGFAILVKPLVLFAITGAFLGITLYRGGSIRTLLDKKTIAFFFICFSPLVLYYGYKFS